MVSCEILEKIGRGEVEGLPVGDGLVGGLDLEEAGEKVAVSDVLLLFERNVVGLSLVEGFGDDLEDGYGDLVLEELRETAFVPDPVEPGNLSHLLPDKNILVSVSYSDANIAF